MYINHKLSELIHNWNTEKVAVTNSEKRNSNYKIPEPYYSLNEYYTRSFNGYNWAEFESNDSYWYDCDHNISVHGYIHAADYFDSQIKNGNHIETNRIISNNHNMNYPKTKIGILSDPLIRFIMCLRFDNEDLVTNITGHYRGGWICGPQYLRDILKSDGHKWWAESQLRKYQRLNIDVIFTDNVIKQYIQDVKSDQTIRKSIMEDNKMSGLFSVLELMRNEQLPSQVISNQQPNYSVYIHRHYFLEESAWEYMKDPELYDLLVEKYKQDFQQGGFPEKPRLGSWQEYWEARLNQ